MVTRTLDDFIKNKLGRGKAIIIIMGARPVGKTTLLKKVFSNTQDILWLNGDEKDVQDLFQHSSSTRLEQYFGKKRPSSSMKHSA